jgi:hypothetical protein
MLLRSIPLNSHCCTLLPSYSTSFNSHPFNSSQLHSTLTYYTLLSTPFNSHPFYFIPLNSTQICSSILNSFPIPFYSSSLLLNLTYSTPFYTILLKFTQFNSHPCTELRFFSIYLPYFLLQSIPFDSHPIYSNAL